jgi:hypothetical protein
MPVTGAASGRRMELSGRVHSVEYVLRYGAHRGCVTAMLARVAKIAGGL